MATGTYEYSFIDGEYTSSSVNSMRRNYIGTRMSGLNTNVRNNVPKFAKINSATCTIRIKRNGSSDLNMYNHDAAWVLYNESDAITQTLESKKQSIKRSFTTFTYNALSYVNSQNANAGVATSICCLSFRASGDLAKQYTYDNYKFTLSYTLPTITVNGTVNNSDYGNVNTDGSFALGSPVDIYTPENGGSMYRSGEIYAVPKTGYKFVSWSDGRTEAWREIKFHQDTLTAHNTVLSYTAIFEPIKYNVTVDVSPSEGGQAIGGGPYEYGKSITLIATPNAGYKFKQWSDGNTNATRTVTVTSDATYTAQFEPICFAVTTDTLCDDGTAGGVVTGGGTYASGSTVTLTATPNEGYEFVQWSDGNTDETRTLTATADSIFTAEFRVLKFTITMQVTPEGAGAVGGAGTYNWGTIVYLIVAALQGYRFVQWSDGVKSESRIVRVTEDVTYTAIFEPENPKQIYIGTSLVKSIYYSATTNTITFMVDGEIPTLTDMDTVDGYHLAISNTAPTDAVEVVDVYVGTQKIYSS